MHNAYQRNNDIHNYHAGGGQPNAWGHGGPGNNNGHQNGWH
jgi:hypothetical protein